MQLVKPQGFNALATYQKPVQNRETPNKPLFYSKRPIST